MNLIMAYKRNQESFFLGHVCVDVLPDLLTRPKMARALLPVKGTAHGARVAPLRLLCLLYFLHNRPPSQEPPLYQSISEVQE